MNSLNLHGPFHLYTTPDKFFIQPFGEDEQPLIINRQDGEIRLPHKGVMFMPPAKSYDIQGIIGIKHLMNNSYLIVITKSSVVGKIFGNIIYKVERTEIIPFKEMHTDVGSEFSASWESIYVKMMDSTLQTPSFYYSRTYDLTNSLQRNHHIAMRKDPHQNNACQYYDKRFLWNIHLMQDLDQCGQAVSRYRLPLILGFIRVDDYSTPLGSGTSWTLVSRRSVKRAGTRFNCRGADQDGNVANFVETEQILEQFSQTITSFVQVRGSIPLVWSQRPKNYKYKPDIEIHNVDHDSVLRKHLGELKDIYGDVSVVCLIDSRGHEGNLAHEFSQRMADIQRYHNIPFHYFDFHKECSKMRWHRLSILLDRLDHEIGSHGYFAKVGNNVIRHQTGVVRSNCIDSLDRTNVVQSMIAKTVLQMQFGELESYGRDLNLSNSPGFMNTFKNVWADNADAISIQYAGTPALKTDFTRTGQRTRQGILKDGLNSLTRYVSNNFLDNYRQDAIDLFLGNYEGYPSPLYRPLELVSYTSKFSFAIVALMLVALYLCTRWT